jgi:hypothetical protein
MIADSWKRYAGVIVAAAVMAPFALAPAHGREPGARPRKDSSERGRAVQELQKAQAELLTSAIEYRDSLERLLLRQDRAVRAATATAEVRRDLKAMGIVSQHDVDQAEQERVQAEERAATTEKRLSEADTFVVELAGHEHLATLPALPPGGYSATAAAIRFNGLAPWSLVTGLVKLQEFFTTRFGRELPVSALGQTPVHDRMGFDHREAVDIGVHPDSQEGQALMAYLRSAGIPFQAFRAAVRRVSTGAHIHVGKASTPL